MRFGLAVAQYRLFLSEKKVDLAGVRPFWKTFSFLHEFGLNSAL